MVNRLSPDIYLLDAAYRAIDDGVIDEYTSFIWTERFSSHGDFQLTVEPTERLRKLLKNGVYLRITDSKYTMQIESVLEETKDGRTLLIARGRTLTLLLNHRVVSKNWVGTGIAGAIIGQLVTIICKDGTGLSPYDAIPGFFVEDLSTGTATISTKPESASYLYDIVKAVCDSAGLGFRIIVKRPNGNPQIWFQVYSGITRNNLIFSVDMDTLTDPSYLESIANYKNVAYVQHAQGTKMVSRYGVSPTVSGYDRKVMTVDAMDVQPADHVPAIYDAILIQRAVQAMASTDGRMIRLYDGEVPLDIKYKYGTDYDLGDIVTYSGTNIKQKQKARVTEYIRAYDSEGIKSYPTFSVVDE